MSSEIEDGSTPIQPSSSSQKLETTTADYTSENKTSNNIALQSSADSQELGDNPASFLRCVFSLISAMLFGLVIGYDFAAVSTILPTLGVYFFNQSVINFVSIVFVFALAAMLPLLIKIGDMFRHRFVFAPFALMHIGGAFMSGAAKGMPLLLSGRAISGVGAAGTTMTSIIAIARLGSRKQRARGLLIVLASWLLGSILGFAIGSHLTGLNSWKWVFYAETPFLIVASLVGIVAFNIRRPVEQEALASRLKRLDILGWLLLTGCVLSLILALNQGQNVFAWVSGVVIGIFVLAAFLLIGFIVVERYVAVERILPTRIVHSKASGLMVFVQLFTGMAMFPPFIYQVAWYHVVKNVSSKSAALYVMPSAIVALVSALATMYIISFWKKIRLLFGISMLFMVLGTGLLISMNQNTSNALPALYMAIFGIGVGISMQPHVLLFCKVSGDTAENVIGTLLFTRYLGASIGVAIFNTAFQNILATKLAETVLSHLLYTKYILDAPDNEDVMRLSAVPQTVRDDVAKNNSQAMRIAFIANIIYISLAAVLCLPLVLRSLFRKSPVHNDR